MTAGAARGRSERRSWRRRPVLLVSAALLFAVAAAAWLGWNVFYARRVADEARARLVRQEYLYGVILRLDEVLTTAARLRALVGEERWEARYAAHALELDAAVAEAGSFAASCGEAIRTTADANDELLVMERRSFDLVRGGQREAAQALLFSPAYEEQKRRYREGVDQFIASCRAHAEAAHARERSFAATVVIATYALVLLSLAVAIRVLRRGVVRPLERLAAAAASVTAEGRDAFIEVTSDDAVGTLQAAFNAMLVRLAEQRAELAQRNAELEGKQAELEAHAAQQARLLATIQELSTPLLPLTNGVLVLPVVGTVDEPRAAALMQTLLAGVARHDAHTAILDVTGISLMDGLVMRLLLLTAKAARLMGTRVVLAGISPAMANTIVVEAIDLHEVETVASLGDALARVAPGAGEPDPLWASTSLPDGPLLAPRALGAREAEGLRSLRTPAR